MKKNINRYSDSALEEFQVLLEKKRAKTREQIKCLEDQLLELDESANGIYGSNFGDDSHLNNDREMLNEMLNRQRKHLQELNSALTRIHNKTYGVCEVTGQLIDKRRLLIVPTTTRSLPSKMGKTAS